MGLIDADALGKQGWIMYRTVAVNPQTTEMQTKKPTDFPTIIDAVPVVHGEWIPGREISREMIGDCTVSIEYEDYKCSVCGFGIDRIVYWKDGTPVVKYCPNCGARMEKKNG